MICSNESCKKEFDAKTHNQKYCCDDCCRVATNRKIMLKYYEKKAIKNGSKRNCSKCDILLSRYNSLNICSKCEKNSSIKNKKKILGMINDIS